MSTTVSAVLRVHVEIDTDDPDRAAGVFDQWVATLRDDVVRLDDVALFVDTLDVAELRL